MNGIKYWFVSLFRVWRHEYSLVFKDLGVILFFIALPLGYPIAYTLIYNPELVREVPMAVVDNCRSAESRELVRDLDATQYIDVIGYATSLSEAKRWQMERGCYGVLLIPEDYSRNLARNEQGVVELYSDMGLLLRYRGFLYALTDVSLALGAEIRTADINSSPVAMLSDMVDSSVETGAHFLGDVTQGFASFVMPGIVILILQQSLILGVCMLGGGHNERRRANNGIDPQWVNAPVSASILGKTMCYFSIYAPLTVYILHYIPEMFSLPHIGSMSQYLPFVLPMLLAASFLGFMLQPLVRERETSFLVIVFTSVWFLFLSGLTWPRYAMSDVWYLLGSLIPATWGVEGFIVINSNGSTIADVSQQYLMLWLLAAAYFVMAVLIHHYVKLRSGRSLRPTAHVVSR